MFLRALSYCIVVCSAGWSLAANWPHFQGPARDGSSPETGLLRSWLETGPTVVWRTPIKQGWNSPSVVGDSVYLCWTEAPRGGQETTACLDAATGATRWKHTYECDLYWKANIGWAKGGVRSTPTVTNKFVYTLGAVGHLHCLDRQTGAVIWARELSKSWGPSGEKGYSFSPLVVGDRLVLYLGDSSFFAGKEDDRTLICAALDPLTGRDEWVFHEPHLKTAPGGEGQTPAIADFGGEPCAVISGNCQLKAIRIRDGREIWKFDCIRPDARGMTIPTPLVTGKMIVNIPDIDVPHVVEVDRQDPAFPTRMLWKRNLHMPTAIHQMRKRDGFLYGFSGAIKGDSDLAASESTLRLTCIELATGKVMWSQEGFQNGISLIEADGLLFVRSYQTLRLVEATPEGYRERGKIKTHDVWKPTVNLTDIVCPVLSNGKLYVRTPEELICYRVQAE